MEVQRFAQGDWGVGGGEFAGGCLTEGMDSAVCPAGSSNRNRVSVDFFERLLECKLDRGFGILSLPAEKVLPAVGQKETVRNRLHSKINGGRLRAKAYRSSR